MTIMVTGGSGFIGTALCKRLLEKNHTVIVVAKKAPPFTHKRLFFIVCDLETQSFPYDILERTDAVINLAGKKFYRRWKKETLTEIMESRIATTRKIIESIEQTNNRPATFICASSIFYYGERDSCANEDTKQGSEELAEGIAAWESQARQAEAFGVRTVLLRTATVFGRGGFLDLVKKTNIFGLLWKMGGKAFVFSWVHQIDIVNAYVFALETNTVEGPVNVASPYSITRDELFLILGRIWKCRVLGVMPKRLRKLFFGEAYRYLACSCCAAPTKLLNKGFVFTHEYATKALESIYD